MLPRVVPTCRRRVGREGEACGMDARLWGELQRYIDLKEIFGKLPMWEFFQLRLVCKDWNRLASDRTFLEESFRDPILKPYFVVNAYSVGRRKLACLLTYDASSRRWSSTRLPSFLDLYSGDLVTGGLIHSYHHLRVSQERVFSIHTRTSHTLPEPLQFESSVNPLPTSPFPFRAMAVDATVTPHTFQLILSESSKNPPQIYNSKTNSWTLALSREVALAPGNAICKRSVLYTRYDTHIMAYSPEENTWFQLEPPPGTSDTNRRSIGAWDGRLFDVTMDLEQRSITVWEFGDHYKQEWKAFERISEDFSSWLMHADHLIPPLGLQDLEIRSCYCDEYVLVYSSLPEEGFVERFVMCNLATRKWEKIDVGRLVHFPHREERNRNVGHKLMRSYAMPEFDDSLLLPGY